MKLTSINIQNFQSLRHVQLPLQAPITLIAGDNEAGKSSLCEAIRMAILGEHARVDYKKDLGLLVTDGASEGSITIEAGEAGVSVLLPEGKQHGEFPGADSPVLPYLLEPSRFARASADERRTLLFKVTGSGARAAVVKEMLKARGCDETLAEGILPMLRSGFPAAKEYADGKARDAKADWRAVTGEAWGSKKAEAWQAVKPDFDAALLADLTAEGEKLGRRIGEQQEYLGGLRAKAEAFKAWQMQSERRESTARSLPSLRTKLKTDQDNLAEWAEKVTALEGQAGTGPREGLVHDLARCLDEAIKVEQVNDLLPGALEIRVLQALEAYETQHGKIGAQGDPEAAAQLPAARKARDLMQRSVDNDLRDIAAAELAASGDDGAAVECVEPEDLQRAQGELQRLQVEQREIQQRVQTLLDAKRAAEGAAEKTSAATSHHAIIGKWLAISDAMAPDGIPGELLAAAVGPFNKLLAELSGIAGWAPVQLDADQTIRCGQRLYRQQSASAQWRADAIITLALAEMSGLRLALLDAFDIMNLAGRGEVIDLLDALAVAGRIDTVILLGTLKAPTTPPTDAFETHWIENGCLGAPAALREAA